MKKMQQELSDALAKMDNDALSAVRDFLAPTLEKVKDTAAALEKFSFTTEFKLTELHEKKESKKNLGSQRFVHFTQPKVAALSILQILKVLTFACERDLQKMRRKPPRN